jgi:tetratricopeptide (TPR) repeat protein
MPSHTYNRVGRWGDATRANIIARQSDLKAQTDQGFAIYPSHNLQMLLFSASLDGQSAVAIQAARDYARIAQADGDSFLALTMVRFGRFVEVLELVRPPTQPIHQGLWAFGRGLAHLRTGSPDSARASLAIVDSLATNTPATRTFRVHTPANLLGLVGNILRGEIYRSESRALDANAAFEKALEFETGLTYDEPEPLPFTARDFLGAFLLEQGRTADAELVYEAALEARPRNGWSLTGLEQSLRAQGKTSNADEAKNRLEQAWIRADVWLPGSRF